MTAPHPEPIREPVSAEHVAALAEVLHEHRYGALTCYDHTPTPERPSWCCVCGAHDLMTSWRAHVAHAILASPAMRDLLADERARALCEAADYCTPANWTGPAATLIHLNHWLRTSADREQP